MTHFFEATHGEEIRRPIGGRIATVAVALGMLVAGIACLLLECFHFMTAEVRGGSGPFFKAGAVLTSLGALGTPLFIYLMLRPPRLILGQDRYQIVVGASKVIENIPYALIEDIVLKDMTCDVGYQVTVRQIGVKLRDTPDAEVKLSTPGNLKTFGYHCILQDSYAQPLAAIYEKLRAQWTAQPKQPGPASEAVSP